MCGDYRTCAGSKLVEFQMSDVERVDRVGPLQVSGKRKARCLYTGLIFSLLVPHTQI